MVATLLYALFILACIILIAAVLLQPGKADAGALFTSTVNSAAFGPRGTQTILAKITIGAAIGFMLIALLLSLPGITGPRSVLQSTPVTATPTPVPSPAATAPAVSTTPAQTNENANAPNNANASVSPAATKEDAKKNENKGDNKNTKKQNK